MEDPLEKAWRRYVPLLCDYDSWKFRLMSGTAWLNCLLAPIQLWQCDNCPFSRIHMAKGASRGCPLSWLIPDVLRYMCTAHGNVRANVQIPGKRPKVRREGGRHREDAPKCIGREAKSRIVIAKSSMYCLILNLKTQRRMREFESGNCAYDL